MKKLFSITSLIIILLTLTVFPKEYACALDFRKTWTPFQVSIWPGWGNWPSAYNVNGLKLGLPFSFNQSYNQQRISGVDLALATHTSYVDGLQLAWINLETQDINGVQIAGLNITKNFSGAEFGLCNAVSESNCFQFGAVNVGYTRSNVIEVGIVNDTAMKTNGTLFGLLNMSNDFSGFQFGFINVKTGVRYVDENKSAFQLGLINYMEDGFFPFFPFFNFSN